MTYYPEIHKRKSIRLQGYDYSQNGLYFITICTKDRLCLFGKIEKWEMVLNQSGNIAQQCWLEIPEHFPDVILHEYVIMPNHIHGIIEINAKDHSGIEKQNHFQKIIPHSIGSIVRGYKIGVTKWFRQNTDVHDVWQRNYYEHIIRNQESYENISQYIFNNPAQWQEDKFYSV